MRIGLNGTPFDHLASGARDRFLNLYGRAAGMSAAHEFLVYSPREFDLEPLFTGPVAGGCRTPFSPTHTLYRFLSSGRWFRRRLAEDRVDLFVTDHFPVVGDSTLLTIHDLRFLALPDVGSPLRRAWFRTRFAAVAARARAVVTVSEIMRGEILDRLALPPEQVHVVPNGVAADFRRTERRLPGLPEEYLLTVGVLERRKNLAMLLRLLARDPDLPPLVISGRGGPEEGALRGLAAELGLGDRVRFVGYTEEHDLPALYSGARAVLMPSVYEGFGLPVPQAFACGTPVVCSNASALPEVAGEAALLADPEDEKAWGAALTRVLSDDAHRDRLAAAGLARAEALSWESAAERFLALLADPT